MRKRDFVRRERVQFCSFEDRFLKGKRIRYFVYKIFTHAYDASVLAFLARISSENNSRVREVLHNESAGKKIARHDIANKLNLNKQSRSFFLSLHTQESHKITITARVETHIHVVGKGQSWRTINFIFPPMETLVIIPPPPFTSSREGGGGVINGSLFR